MQSMMVTLNKCFNGMAPSYLRAYIQEWGVSNYNLRGYFMLEIRLLGLAPMVYDLLDIITSMPGMTFPMISENLIRLPATLKRNIINAKS